MARYLFWSFCQCLCECVCVCVCALLCVFIRFEGERYLFVCSSDRCPFWPEHFSQLLQRIIACPKTVSFPRKSNKSQVLIIARIREQKRRKKGNARKETRQAKAAEQQQIYYSYMSTSLLYSPLLRLPDNTPDCKRCLLCKYFVHIPRVPAYPYWTEIQLAYCTSFCRVDLFDNRLRNAE